MMTFPFSPFPGGTTRMKDWNSAQQDFDSGDRVGLSNWIRPLYRYTLPIQNMTEIKQSSLWAFWDSVRANAFPFLLKDPYDNAVNSVMGVRSGTSTGTLFLYDTRSYMVRADTTSVGSLFSALSGYVKLGTDYNYDQDSGVLTLVTKSNTDVWGVRSMSYFKKCFFRGDYKETSRIWNIFNGQLQIDEVP
jgi:hypothetical protein